VDGAQLAVMDRRTWLASRMGLLRTRHTLSQQRRTEPLPRHMRLTMMESFVVCVANGRQYYEAAPAPELLKSFLEKGTVFALVYWRLLTAVSCHGDGTSCPSRAATPFVTLQVQVSMLALVLHSTAYAFLHITSLCTG